MVNSNVKKISIGTVQFGMDYGISNTLGKTSKSEVRAILLYAREIGLDTIDTASAYGNSEDVLGEIGVNGFKLISKFLPSEGGFSKQLSNSLYKLRIKKLYGYLAHRPLDLLMNRSEWDALQNHKSLGNINKIGFSLNYPSEFNDIMEAGMIPDLIQVPYNFLDRRFEEHLIEAKKYNIEVHTRSCFLQGLFFKKVDHLDSFFNPIKGVLNQLQLRENMIGDLINYVASKPFIDKVVIGNENLQQLKQNIDSLTLAQVIDLPIPDLRNDEVLIPAMWKKNRI